MANGLFTPQQQIAQQLALGNQLIGQPQQANVSGLSPFAGLARGLTGGFLRGQATSAQQRNQQLRQQVQADLGKALAGGDLNAAASIAAASPIPEHQQLGLRLAAQAPQRAESAERLRLARAANAREERKLKSAEAAARRQQAARERNRNLQAAVLKQFGFGAPTTQEAVTGQSFAAVPPGTTSAAANEAMGIRPGEAAVVPPPDARTVGAVRHQASVNNPSPAIDPTTKALAASQIAFDTGDGKGMIAGLKTMATAQNEANKQFRPTQKQRSDFALAKATAAELNRELKRYEKLVKKWGFETFNTEGAQAIKTTRTNLVLKLKDLHTLGALAGPDKGLLDNLVFDPTLPVEDTLSLLSFPFRAMQALFINAPDRAKLSADMVRDMATSGIAAKAQVLGLSPVLPTLPNPILPDEQPEKAGSAPGPGAVNAAPARSNPRVDVNGNMIQ